MLICVEFGTWLVWWEKYLDIFKRPWWNFIGSYVFMRCEHVVWRFQLGCIVDVISLLEKTCFGSNIWTNSILDLKCLFWIGPNGILGDKDSDCWTLIHYHCYFSAAIAIFGTHCCMFRIVEATILSGEECGLAHKFVNLVFNV